MTENGVERGRFPCVTPEFVAKAMSEPIAFLPPPLAAIPIALVQVSDVSAEDLVHNIEIVIAAAEGCGAREAVISSFALLSFPGARRRDEELQAVVAKIVGMLGENCRIIMGTVVAHHGVQSAKGDWYGLAYPGMEKLLRALLSAPMGSVVTTESIGEK